MDTAGARRKVQITGDGTILNALAKGFGSGTPCIVAEGGDHFMYSEVFESLPTQNDAKQLAQRQLNLMAGITKLSDNGDYTVKAGTVYERQPDGKFVGYVIADPITFRGVGRMEILDPTDTKDRDLFSLLTANPAAEKAIRIFNNDQSYQGLFKVYEIVREGVGGEKALQASGWMSGNQIKNFGGTANHPELLGDLARHGTWPAEPVKKPMPLSEAREVIRALLDKWMRKLLQET